MPDINELSNGSLEINMSGTIRLRISSTGHAHAYRYVYANHPNYGG